MTMDGGLVGWIFFLLPPDQHILARPANFSPLRLAHQIWPGKKTESCVFFLAHSPPVAAAARTQKYGGGKMRKKGGVFPDYFQPVLRFSPLKNIVVVTVTGRREEEEERSLREIICAALPSLPPCPSLLLVSLSKLSPPLFLINLLLVCFLPPSPSPCIFPSPLVKEMHFFAGGKRRKITSRSPRGPTAPFIR